MHKSQPYGFFLGNQRPAHGAAQLDDPILQVALLLHVLGAGAKLDHRVAHRLEVL